MPLAGLVTLRSDIAGGTGGEGERGRSDPPGRDGIEAPLDLLPVLGQTHVGESAQVHLSALAMKRKAQHPLPGAGSGHHQPQATAPRMGAPCVKPRSDPQYSRIILDG